MLVVATYLLPLLVGLGVTQDPSAWKLGFFTALGKQVWQHRRASCSFLPVGRRLRLGRLRAGQALLSAKSRVVMTDQPTFKPPSSLCQVGGAWLAWWVVAAAAVSQIGQFEVR